MRKQDASDSALRDSRLFGHYRRSRIGSFYIYRRQSDHFECVGTRTLMDLCWEGLAEFDKGAQVFFSSTVVSLDSQCLRFNLLSRQLHATLV